MFGTSLRAKGAPKGPSVVQTTPPAGRIESGFHAFGPPHPLPGRLDVEHPSGLPRDPASLHVRRPADQRRLRFRHDASQDGPGAQPRPSGRRVGRAATDPAARGVRRVQGQPRGDGGRSRRAASRDPRGPGGISDPGHRAARLRGRRRHRLSRQEGRVPGLRRGHRHRRQRHAAAGLRGPDPGLPHGQRGLPGRLRRDRVLRRRARPGRRRAGPHGRQRRQHPRRARRRAGHGQEVDHRVREPDGPARARRRHQGQGRREPAGASRRRPALAPPRRDPGGPAGAFRSDGPPPLRARLREAEGALRPTRVPFARGRDSRRRRRGARAHVRASGPREPVSGDRRSGGRLPADAQRPRSARGPLRREDIHRRRRVRGDRAPLEGPGEGRRRIRDGRCEAARRPARRSRRRGAGRRLRRVPGAVRPGPGCRHRRARADGVPAPRPAAGARQGGRGVRLRPARVLRDRACRPVAGRARLRRRRAGAGSLGRARRAAGARPSLPRHRTAAHSRPRADGAGRGGGRQPASRRDLEADGGRAARLSSRRSGPRPARNST